MNWTPAEAIARAVLYEGYLLYPYRASALKNRRRPMFGTIGPDDAPALAAECLVEGTADAALAVKLRFLQDLPDGAVEREVEIGGISIGELSWIPLRRDFEFPPCAGTLQVSAERRGADLWKIGLRIEGRGAAALVSCHAVLGVRGGGLLSGVDSNERCASQGLWPILVGAPPDRSLILFAPIILPDYPLLAPESPGDLFDLTEIDEILSLRIRTLSESEKEEIRSGEGRARALLERTDALSSGELFALHGRGGSALKVGDVVRLCPRGRADVMDLALAGREATVVALEEDLEGRRYVAVTVNDDPGRDLGERGYLGHRFYFRPEELERL
jgi:hypothetical protein